EEADQELRRERLGGQRSAWPRLPEVGQVPACGHEPVESAPVAQDRFDGIVRQVVEREEPPLESLLALPGHRPVVPHAAQRRRAVGPFLDADEHRRRASRRTPTTAPDFSYRALWGRRGGRDPPPRRGPAGRRAATIAASRRGGATGTAPAPTTGSSAGPRQRAPRRPRPGPPTRGRPGGARE